MPQFESLTWMSLVIIMLKDLLIRNNNIPKVISLYYLYINSKNYTTSYWALKLYKRRVNKDLRLFSVQRVYFNFDHVCVYPNILVNNNINILK